MKLEMLPVYPKTGSENEKINKKNFNPYKGLWGGWRGQGEVGGQWQGVVEEQVGWGWWVVWGQGWGGQQQGVVRGGWQGWGLLILVILIEE